jgi:lysophospholipase L1-like esterase
MKIKHLNGIAAATLVTLFVFPVFAEEASPHARWEKAIQRFEEKDKESPPPKHANLFVGSSSIVMWNLDESFPEYEVINRGFGGSETADSTYFADRIVIPHEPDVVFLYAGDNDIAGGKSPAQVFEDFKAFVAKVHEALPDTKIVYIAIKPSTARWNLVGKMRETNALVEEETESNDLLAFIDIDPLMLGEDGTPREDFLLSDGLHLTKSGYAVWAEAVRPHLKKKN